MWRLHWMEETASMMIILLLLISWLWLHWRPFATIDSNIIVGSSTMNADDTDLNDDGDDDQTM